MIIAIRDPTRRIAPTADSLRAAPGRPLPTNRCEPAIDHRSSFIKYFPTAYRL